MEQTVRFFWERWKRGCQMGSKYELEALEWMEAFKNTLSNSKKKEFDKYWSKWEDELDLWNNGNPKQTKNMNPMRIPS